MRAALASVLLVASCGRVSFDGLSSDGGSDAPATVEPGVTTIAGGPSPGSQDGVGGEALFDNPVNVAVGPDDTIYVADFNSGHLRAVTPEGVVTTVGQQPIGVDTFGLAVTADGTIYVSDDGGALYQVDRATGISTTLATGLGEARGILPISATQIAIASWLPARIVLVDPTTGTTTQLAGGATGYMEGNGATAQFMNPTDLVRFPDGRILVADQANQRLRLVSLSGDVSTYAGSGDEGFMDGPVTSAMFDIPTGLAIARDGTIYVSDRFNHRIRKITPAGVVSTVAGNGMEGFADNVDPLQAEFFAMEGLALSNDERYLYIADGSAALDGVPYNRLRRLSL